MTSQPRRTLRNRVIFPLAVMALAALLAPVVAMAQAPASAKDPVCGMTVNTADAKYSSTHAGTTYYFCSESCKQKFDKEPAKYVAKQGEKPAVSAKDPICGMTVKTADAKYMSAYQGKNYYFCSESCKQKFDKEPAKYAVK